MTGRAAGFCVGYNAPGFANPVPGGMGRGFGGGFARGGGRGWRNRFWATGMTGWQRAAAAIPEAPTDEAEALRAQAEQLETALKNVRSRLEALDSAGD